MAYVAGTLRIDGVSVSDATDGDDAEIVPAGPGGGTITFRVALLHPGECRDFTFQAQALLTCGGQTAANDALMSWNGGGPIQPGTVYTPIATYSLVESVTDVTSPATPAGNDVLEYAIEFCNASPSGIALVTIDDVLPIAGGLPLSGCGTTYVPGSMTISVDGSPEQPLTDRQGDDGGTYFAGPPESIAIYDSPVQQHQCFVVRYQVRVDPGCAEGSCVVDASHATYGSPPTDIDSNTVSTCMGALLTGVPYRNVGRASLVATGGCEFGPRLLSLSCPDIPGICRPDVAGVRWTMLRDQLASGQLVTFYEVPGTGCCVATPPDPRYLSVRKSGTDDVVLELVQACP
jgi:uncharacterized repeat protein (TIGR01451 family)